MINPVSLELVNNAVTALHMPNFSIGKLRDPAKIIDLQKALFDYQVRIELITKGIEAASSTVRRLGAGQ